LNFSSLRIRDANSVEVVIAALLRSSWRIAAYAHLNDMADMKKQMLTTIPSHSC
jgi:hypothetical protein